MVEESIYHERVTSKNSLVESELVARIDLRFLLFEDHLHDAEVHVARVAKKFVQEILLIYKYINIETMSFH